MGVGDSTISNPTIKSHSYSQYFLRKKSMETPSSRGCCCLILQQPGFAGRRKAKATLRYHCLGMPWMPWGDSWDASFWIGSKKGRNKNCRTWHPCTPRKCSPGNVRPSMDTVGEPKKQQIWDHTDGIHMACHGH